MKHLLKCYLALVYESLLMLALTLALTALYYMLLGDASQGWRRAGLQAVLWVSMGAYFVHCWTHSGQTLASQTWRLKVVAADGRLLQRPAAIRRYVLATVLLLPAGLTWWWALLDREQCFLHDRLLGSRVIALSTGNAAD